MFQKIRLLILTTLFAGLLAGCASPSSLMSTPEKKYIVEKVYFGTDRNNTHDADPKKRYGYLRSDVSYGVAYVSIPDDHVPGKLEEPRWFQDEDPNDHVILMNVDHLDKEAFLTTLRDRIHKQDGKKVLIFIHGYNNSFEDAARRTAQLRHDLQFPGPAVFYSWPSRGSLPGYGHDENNIDWSVPLLKAFLKDVVEETEADNVYLIAHSMGNRYFSEAYVELIDENPSLKPRLREIIMAAPDIDAEVFKRDIAPVMAGYGIPVTVYMNKGDVPVEFSNIWHKYPRLGDPEGGIFVHEEFDFIDASEVVTGILEHSYFAESKILLEDLKAIINFGLPPENRDGLTGHPYGTGTYWSF